MPCVHTDFSKPLIYSLVETVAKFIRLIFRLKMHLLRLATPNSFLKIDLLNLADANSFLKMGVLDLAAVFPAWNSRLRT
jgi:hypothetical protein